MSYIKDVLLDILYQQYQDDVNKCPISTSHT